jgi:hypothetical protein
VTEFFLLTRSQKSCFHNSLLCARFQSQDNHRALHNPLLCFWTTAAVADPAVAAVIFQVVYWQKKWLL